PIKCQYSTNYGKFCDNSTARFQLILDYQINQLLHYGY
ncbi:MAG: hypothetical protein RIR67_788, partial [Bacteroidota bacterium]